MLLKIWVHFVADFVLQSDWMAMNKSKNSLLGIGAMWVHFGIYTVTLVPFFGCRFSIVNGLLHFATDMITSRATSYLWTHQQRHWFFVVIGFDQAIHLTCLLLT